MTRPPDVAPPPRRVLLVEDDPEDALLVTELLAETGAPFELTHMTSVAEAVASGQLAVVDCVLLDLQLPGSGTDRLDTLRRLRESDRTARSVCSPAWTTSTSARPRWPRAHRTTWSRARSTAN